MYTLTSEGGKYDDRFLTNYNNINIIPAIIVFLDILP